MEEIKVSVIIPIYKVEKYLRQCVDSVLDQTYRNLEVILVDDGSPDGCPALCDDYAAKDERVTVIHKENGGQSDARNAGVLKATGDYGIFIDSDDYWDAPCALEHLMERLLQTHTEVLNFAYYKLREETNERTDMLASSENRPRTLSEKEEQLDYITGHSLYVASAWNKLISLSLLKKLPFQKGVFSEDVEWCLRLMAEGQSFDFVNECFYCYRQRAGSISQGVSEKNCRDLKDAIIACMKIFDNSSGNREFLGRYIAYQFSTFIAIQAFPEKQPNDCIRELGKYKNILRYYGSSRKVRIMYYGTKLVGFPLWCRIIRLTKNLWNSRRDKI